MKCTVCGYAFDETIAKKSCRGCPMQRGCTRIKCPNCGFETPPEPAWAKYFKRGRKSDGR